MHLPAPLALVTAAGVTQQLEFRWWMTDPRKVLAGLTAFVSDTEPTGERRPCRMNLQLKGCEICIFNNRFVVAVPCGRVCVLVSGCLCQAFPVGDPLCTHRSQAYNKLEELAKQAKERRSHGRESTTTVEVEGLDASKASLEASGDARPPEDSLGASARVSSAPVRLFLASRCLAVVVCVCLCTCLLCPCACSGGLT